MFWWHGIERGSTSFRVETVLFGEFNLAQNISFSNYVIGRHFTFNVDGILHKVVFTTQIHIFKITCNVWSMQYVGMTKFSISTRFANLLVNHQWQTLLWEHFSGSGHVRYDCIAQIICYSNQDDEDKKDVFMEEYYLRVLTSFQTFGSNVNSLNTNLWIYDFQKINCLNANYLSHAQPEKLMAKENNSQTI